MPVGHEVLNVALKTYSRSKRVYRRWTMFCVAPGYCRGMAIGLPYSSPLPPSSAAAFFFARALQG